MKNILTEQELVNKLRQLYIQRYEALYNEDNHVKGNRLERQFTKIEEELIVFKEGVLALRTLLDDESEVVRCYAASTLISLFLQKKLGQKEHMPQTIIVSAKSQLITL